MQRSDFHYELPEHLIAQHPVEPRSASRMLVLPAEGEPQDRRFRDLPSLLQAGDLLVFNDTRVIPARLFGHKEATGGRVEVLVERITGEHEALAHVRASKAPGPGTRLRLEEVVVAEVIGREGDLFRLRFDNERSVLSLLEAYGHVPLPPYVRRADEAADVRRYQTVYARRPGAVAAPTAGLHFDEPMLERLRERGIEFARLTLHVGAGTFQPVRVNDIREHRMHAEWLEVPQSVCEAVARTRARGGRVVAVGTTVVRALETAAAGRELAPYRGETRLFITPGYRFRVVDALLTNFHLPESTLLMLVCAFGGYHEVMRAYRHAVKQEYRFFSYGDAMFVVRREG